MKKVYLIGLSGHALVAHDILIRNNFEIGSYFELEAKKDNLLGLKYFGEETSPAALKIIKENDSPHHPRTFWPSHS